MTKILTDYKLYRLFLDQLFLYRKGFDVSLYQNWGVSRQYDCSAFMFPSGSFVAEQALYYLYYVDTQVLIYRHVEPPSF